MDIYFEDNVGNKIFSITDDITFVIHHITCNEDGDTKDIALFNFSKNGSDLRYYFIPVNEFNINQILKYFRKHMLSWLREFKKDINREENIYGKNCNIVELFYKYLSDSEKLYLEI